MPSAARAAKNEDLFREVNERIHDLQQEFGRAYGTVSFVCECSINDCAQQLALSVDEYEEVRTHPRHFVLAPGHVDPDHERVIHTTTRFVVVEKFGLAGDIAEQDAP